LLPTALLLLTLGAQAQAQAQAPYRADTNSGAVTFRVGDVFRGPGPITVGYLGAKKQLLLPNGDWRVLAAVDYNSRHTSPMPLTSVAFGQFDGPRLRSLLVTTSTRRPGKASNTWNELSHCQADQGGSLWQESQERFPLSQCARVQPLAPARLREQLPQALAESLDQHLPAMGGTWPAVNLKSTLVVTDRLAALLQMQRFDCVPVKPGADTTDTCTAIPRAWLRDDPTPPLQARLEWARAYATLAARGMNKDLDADELQANPAAARPTTQAAALSLPD
jgi:hypothetical protein